MLTRQQKPKWRNSMNTFEEYLESLKSKEQQDKLLEIINWIDNNYPQLEHRVAWNSPTYTHNKTFIIGLSAASKHISINPEPQAMDVFSEKIKRSGYSQTQSIFRILLVDKIDFALIKEIVDYNILDKKDCATFWR